MKILTTSLKDAEEQEPGQSSGPEHLEDGGTVSKETVRAREDRDEWQHFSHNVSCVKGLAQKQEQVTEMTISFGR